MGRANFPPVGSPLRTPPVYKPEDWAIRFLDLGTENVRREEWRKYPNLQACHLALRAWSPGSHRTENNEGGRGWCYNPWRAEVWEFIGASHQQWVIVKVYEFPAGHRWEIYSEWTQ